MKKIVSLLLAAVMLAAFVPAGAVAQGFASGSGAAVPAEQPQAEPDGMYYSQDDEPMPTPAPRKSAAREEIDEPLPSKNESDYADGEPMREVYSGTCGTNVTWTLDTGTRVLEISGTGAMTNYSSPSSAPWYTYRTYIQTVDIGSGVTSIGQGAFFKCVALNSVTIGNSVTSIGYGAFNGCTSLTSVTIPDSVTSIGSSAFDGCTSLSSVTIGNGVTGIGDYAFRGCTSLTSVTIGSGVTSIGSVAFYGCTSLTSVTIPDGVTSIGGSAFYDCTSLTSVTIPDSVTYIGSSAFRGCTSLTSVTIPDGVTRIYDQTFYGCTSLTSVTIPDSVTSIYSDAFYGCTSLTSITIPDSVTSIGYRAFYNCTSLTSVNISDIAAWCGISFHIYCSNPLTYAHNLYLNGILVTDIVIPDSVTSIGSSAFYNCTSLTSVTIPDGVTSIGGYAFYRCTSLTSVTIPDSVTSISDWAFRSCTSLTSVSIPDSVTSIGSSAFSGCTSLTSVTIGNGVTSIGSYAFYICTSLTSVTIPDSVTSIGEGAFRYCTSLTAINVVSDNPNYKSIDGVLFNKEGTVLICYPAGKEVTSYTIPSGVTSISGAAFEGCTSLTSVTIPDGVTSIGKYAFYNCTSLTSVTIPDGVTSIGDYAFKGCTRLTSATFLGGPPASFGYNGFASCASGFTIYYTAAHASEWAPNGETTWNGYPIELMDSSIVPGDSGFVPVDDLDIQIAALIFADLAYQKIPMRFKEMHGGSHYTVKEWIDTKDLSNGAAKLKQPVYYSSDKSKLDIYRLVGNWEIIDIINGDAGYAATVFKKGDDIIIAYRGSEADGPLSIFEGEDWWVDAEFAILNYLDPRQFDAALNTYNKYAGNGNVILTGHSLGGALATYVSLLTGATGYAYDGACGHVIDLTYLYKYAEIDFKSKNDMHFINYTDPRSLCLAADIIQHTNADLMYGYCYETNPDVIDYYGALSATHQIYSNTRINSDGSAIEFMPRVETHMPKYHWTTSVSRALLVLLDVLPSEQILDAAITLGTDEDDNMNADLSFEANYMFGGSGCDNIHGGIMSDVIMPNSLEGDRLCGGLGSDRYVIDYNNDGEVFIEDTDGKDAIVIANIPLHYIMNLDSIQYLGMSADNQWHRYSIDGRIFINFKRTLFKHKFDLNIIIDYQPESTLCTIDSRGNISLPGKEALDEAESRSLMITGDAILYVYDAAGELAGEYSTEEHSLFCEEFGTVTAYENGDGRNTLIATIYASYTTQIIGDDTVDIQIICIDGDGNIENIMSAEEVSLNNGDALVELSENTVLQEGEDVTTSIEYWAVLVQISSESETIRCGESVVLTAEAINEIGDVCNDISWISTDNNVVQCSSDEYGNCTITAVGVGNAVVYAVSNDNGVNACCTISTYCEHEYEETVVQPSCTTEGYTLHTCIHCGDNYKDEIVDALGHTCEGVNCPTCGERVYSVKFVNRDNSEICTQYVEYADDAIEPSEPSCFGYIYIGWDNDFTNVTHDMIIKALYEPIPYSVFFLDWDGTLIDEQIVGYGTSAIAPTVPEHEGYSFIGWDTDFSVITGETTVTAQYVQKEYYQLITSKADIVPGEYVIVNYDGSTYRALSSAEGSAASSLGYDDLTLCKEVIDGDTYLFDPTASNRFTLEKKSIGFTIAQSGTYVNAAGSGDGVTMSTSSTVWVPSDYNGGIMLQRANTSGKFLCMRHSGSKYYYQAFDLSYADTEGYDGCLLLFKKVEGNPYGAVPHPDITLGDADGNGVLSFSDVAALYNMILSGGGLTAEQEYVCDVNGDGAVSFADVAALYNAVLGAA